MVVGNSSLVKLYPTIKEANDETVANVLMVIVRAMLIWHIKVIMHKIPAVTKGNVIMTFRPNLFSKNGKTMTSGIDKKAGNTKTKCKFHPNVGAL